MSEDIPPKSKTARIPSPDVIGRAVARWIWRFVRPQFGWLVALVILAGFVLRFWGVCWDQYTKLHPDERFINMVATDIRMPNSLGQYFNSDESPLNPYNRENGDFAYGTFPLFLTKVSAEVLENQDFFPLNLIKDGLAKAFTGEVSRWDDYAHLSLVGRLWSALFDTGTILVVFLTGQLLYNRRVALLAALLSSMTVLHIQLAHYFTVDSFLSFFAALTIYYCVRIAKFGRWSDFALAGVAYGFASACKLSGVFLGPIIALAATYHLWSPAISLLRRKEEPATTTTDSLPESEEPDKQPTDWSWLVKPALGFLLAILAAFIVFRISEPYAFAGPNFWNVTIADKFAEDMRDLIGLQSGGNVPFNWEWVGRTAYLFPLENMVLWGMGLPLGIAAWGGFLWATWRLVSRRDATNLLLLVWIAFYFLFWGRQFNHTARYFLPIYPALTLLAASVLNELWQLACSQTLHDFLRRWASRIAPAVPLLLRATVVGVVVLTVLWALAFTNVYRRPLSRVEASAWMIDNLPPKSSITCEHWDDCVPFSLPGKQADFNTVRIESYGPDLSEPSSTVLDSINRADYIVLSSNRLYASIPRAPAKWPLTSNYYKLLLADKLPGFRLVRTFASYPTIFGITINDDSAEGNFTVYDHPKVLLFEKTADYSPERFMAAVSDTCLQVSVPRLEPANADQNALLMRPDDCQTQREGGTWTSIFDPGSFSNRFPLVTWLLVIEAMSLALLPFGLIVFRSLPDRGYLLLKPLGLLVVSWLVWLGASLKLFHFSRGSVIGALILVILFGIIVGIASRRSLLEYVRQHWRALLLSEALFLGAFLVFYWIRILDPDLWHPARGGEKPMELAYLNAVTRSTTMPPYDPWFAGGYLNYYYFGQFMTATMIKLTGILPEIAFNLAVPLFFALTVGAAYSVGYNLAEATRQRMRWRPGRVPIGRLGPVLAGVLGAVLVAVVGNLHGIYQTANRFSKVSDWHVGEGIPVLSGLVGMIGGLWKVITSGADLPPFNYWDPSRMMPPQSSITEFPFFSFLFADLHAHVMAIPFDIAVIGTGLALVLAGRRSGIASHRGQQITSWLGVIVMGLLIGALRPINSWDYPPFLFLGMAAILIGERATEGRLNWPAIGRAALKAVVLAALSIAFFYPFWQNYHLFYKGFHASLQTTPFHQYLAHFGVFLFAAGTLVAVFAWRALRRRPGGPVSIYILTVLGLLILICLAMVFGNENERLPITLTGLSATDFLNDLFANNLPVVAFAMAVIAALGLLAWREFRSNRPDAPLRLFVMAMIALALALSAGVDILTLDGDIDRMNTVFKFYIHVWLLLALASAFGVWYVLAVIRPKPAPGDTPSPTRRTFDALRGVWTVAVAVLVLGALIYPYSGTRSRVSPADRFDQYHGHSNNGMEFMRYAVYGDEGGKNELKYDYEAIWWMRENVEGTPVIVEGQTPNYRWGSRFSIYTGLPTVMGWGWHQKQQRGSFSTMIDERERDLKEFYSSPSTDIAIDFLRKYRVSYVIVGQVERLYYPEEGIAKFAAMDGRELQLVYENPGIQIYRVGSLPPLLPVGSLAQQP